MNNNGTAHAQADLGQPRAGLAGYPGGEAKVSHNGGQLLWLLLHQDVLRSEVPVEETYKLKLLKQVRVHMVHLGTYIGIDKVRYAAIFDTGRRSLGRYCTTGRYSTDPCGGR